METNCREGVQLDVGGRGRCDGTIDGLREQKGTIKKGLTVSDCLPMGFPRMPRTRESDRNHQTANTCLLAGMRPGLDRQWDLVQVWGSG